MSMTDDNQVHSTTANDSQGRSTAAADPQAPVIYDGDEYYCSICREDLNEGDRVCRLQCRHCFHAACWNQMSAARDPSCPNCRGAPIIIGIWYFIGLRPDPTQGQPNLLNTGTTATPRSMLKEYDLTDYDGTSGAIPETHVEESVPVFPNKASSSRGSA